ncbi:DUF547 domain-containing protein [Litoribrevibacter euphylliae]|uniref:DUF547 domain-containing protein n=1 Tax=Litoribrevibacter euphylliae TaxID=1834034 RepID=A0ABV7H9J8_9GAMM
MPLTNHNRTPAPERVHGFNFLRTLVLVSLLLLSQILKAEEWRFWNQSDESNTNTIDHSLWQDNLNKYLLTSHPSAINLYDYKRVTATDHQQLKTYLAQLSHLDPRLYSKDEQMAYWINLYNALTIDVILDHYPVTSIRDLGEGFFSFGPWDDEIIKIANQELTLNDIEHRILRPIWQDARIHYAVNCASLSCPNLAKQAYTANNLERLLKQGAHRYVNHQRGVYWEEDQVELSKIYSWYQEDFGDNEANVIKHLMQYAEPELLKQLKTYSKDTDISYHYDWQLNEVE